MNIRIVRTLLVVLMLTFGSSLKADWYSYCPNPYGGFSYSCHKVYSQVRRYLCDHFNGSFEVMHEDYVAYYCMDYIMGLGWDCNASIPLPDCYPI